MTIAGGSVLGAGAVMMVVGVVGLRNNPQDYWYDDNDEHRKYAAITGVSAILVTGGSIFAIIGGANMTSAKKELKKFQLEVEANPVISGVTIRLRF